MTYELDLQAIDTDGAVREPAAPAVLENTAVHA
jgi:hypothetical protein